MNGTPGGRASGRDCAGGSALVVLAVMLAIGAAACSVETPAPTASASPGPVAAAATASPIPEQDVVEWIKFRRQYGLRSDREWVIAVARQPEAMNDTGIPLLPGELLALGNRTKVVNDMIAATVAYGETRPSTYAGTIVDEGRVVLLVTGPVEPHEAALRLLLPDNGGWEVRSVRWSLEELESFASLVDAELPWFEANEFLVPDASPDLAGNLVEVDFLAASPDRGELLREHLGDPEWLRLEYGGPLPWHGSRGRLTVRVVDKRGRPVEGLYCEAIPIDPSVDADTGESAGTDENGVCRRQFLPAAAYRVVVNRIVNGELQPIGEARATVSADSETKLTIRVKSP